MPGKVLWESLSPLVLKEKPATSIHPEIVEPRASSLGSPASMPPSFREDIPYRQLVNKRALLYTRDKVLGTTMSLTW